MTHWQEEYQKYLQSPGWRYTKFWRKDCKCAECKARANLQLHHDSYRFHNAHPILRWILPNFGDEMRTLCDTCHERFHNEK